MEFAIPETELTVEQLVLLVSPHAFFRQFLHVSVASRRTLGPRSLRSKAIARSYSRQLWRHFPALHPCQTLSLASLLISLRHLPRYW